MQAFVAKAAEWSPGTTPEDSMILATNQEGDHLVQLKPVQFVLLCKRRPLLS